MAVGPVHTYDLLGHLTSVTRTFGESETLVYAPGGELLYRQVGEKFTFYLEEYATVTASGAPGCGAGCIPLASTVEVDAHVVFAGTRIASVKPSRTLYCYRTRLGTVVATSLGGGVPGAGYRYTPYGEVELTVNETEATRSELGYTNALRLTGSLLYLKNRVYDAEARVFIQPDTVDRLRYAYVMGDPVNLSDPTGLLPLADFLNSMNPVQRVFAGAAAWLSRDGSFTDTQLTSQTSEEQTRKESEKQQGNGIALNTDILTDLVTGIFRGVVEGATIPTAPMIYGSQTYADGRAFGMKMGAALDVVGGITLAVGGAATGPGEAALAPVGAALVAKGGVSWVMADSVKADPNILTEQRGEPSKRMNPEQSALVDMAQKDKKVGISQADAQAYKELGRDAKVPVRGPEIHPDRPQGKDPHIHVGPVKHIPVKPEKTP